MSRGRLVRFEKRELTLVEIHGEIDILIQIEWILSQFFEKELVTLTTPKDKV